jgi:hypothetical protein
MPLLKHNTEVEKSQKEIKSIKNQLLKVNDEVCLIAIFIYNLEYLDLRA